MRNIGIMGGTFDPIHYGHLVAAEGARYHYHLDKVIFIPAARPPHKAAQIISDPRSRLAMTALAVASNPYFEVSALEINRPGPSYTIDTVREVAETYHSNIFFITGSDAILQILSWKNVESLLSLCHFIAATRPGYELTNLKETLKDLPAAVLKNITTMLVPALAISSTDIRQRVREGRPIKYLLPDNVEEYVMKHQLYR